MTRWALSVAVAVFAYAGLATSAGAAVYTPTNSVALTVALNAAQVTTDDDKIVLPANTVFDGAPGTIGFVYDGPAAGRLEIVGSGASSVISCTATNSIAMSLIAAAGSSIRDLAFGAEGAGCPGNNKALLSASGIDIVDTSFVVEGAGTAINVPADASVSLRGVRIEGGTPDANSTGVAASDGSSIGIDRTAFRGVAKGVVSYLSATWTLRNTLIDLGGAPGSAGVLLANDAGDSHASAELANVTILGGGDGSAGVHLESFHDYIPAGDPHPTIAVTARNSIISTTGVGSHDLNCPNASFDYSNESVALDYVASDPTTFETSDCSSLTNTNLVNRAVQPLNLSIANIPQAGSSAIDAGDPAFVPAAGELDLLGNCRKIGSAVDLGAYEFGSCPASGGGQGGVGTPLTLKFGKLSGKLRVTGKPRALRRGTKKSKPRIPVTLSAAATVTFKLAPKPKSAKKKAKSLKGQVKLKLAAGTSYLTWSGKWNKKKLKPGKYVLTASASGLATPGKLTVKLVR